MLKPEKDRPKQYPKMDAEQRKAYQQAIAEEEADRDANIEAARPVAAKLRQEREVVAKLVAELKAARVAAGISLGEMEERTGIRKSALSRLENAKAPNPTLATIHRYAAAIGKQVEYSMASIESKS